MADTLKPLEPEPPGKLVLIVKVPRAEAQRLFDLWTLAKKLGKLPLLTLPPAVGIQWWFAPEGSTSPTEFEPSPPAWTEQDEELWRQFQRKAEPPEESPS